MPKYYCEPKELPAGFFEAVQPLARWARAAMREVYRMGYSAGRADSSTEWNEICNRIRGNKKPPTGAAPSVSLS